jgi:hypothetical protein
MVILTDQGWELIVRISQLKISLDIWSWETIIILGFFFMTLLSKQILGSVEGAHANWVAEARGVGTDLGSQACCRHRVPIGPEHDVGQSWFGLICTNESKEVLRYGVLVQVWERRKDRDVC